MVEDKKENKKVNNSPADDKPAEITVANEKTDKKNDQPQIKDTDSGLEDLPEDVKKRLEKKKAEREQKSKKGKTRKKKKKIPRRVTAGKAYIKATYNNTIVTLTDLQGNVISSASAGLAGFKGPKKSTPYAAQIISRLAVSKAREEYGLAEVSVFVKGVGTGRESAVRALNSNGLIVTSIKDVTSIPHNGCRPKKPRRV